MEMQLGITIEKIVTKVKLAQNRPDDIQAFGELWFHTSDEAEPIFKAKGFTIRLKEFKGKKVYNVVFPAFRAGLSFQTSFVAENKALWKDIVTLFLEDFGQLTGGLGSEDITNLRNRESEEIDVDAVAEAIDKLHSNQ